jgi:hypothetical protein
MSASAVIWAPANVGPPTQSSGPVRARRASRGPWAALWSWAVTSREFQQSREGEGVRVLEGGVGERGEGEADRRAGEDLVPGRGDEHAGQVLLFVLAAVDREVPVVEVEAPHRLGQAHRELVADGAHPQARPAAADRAGALDSDQGGVVDRRGRGEGQAQPLVDRRADGASLGGDAGRREQDVFGAVLGAVAVAQRLRAGGQFAVQEPAQGDWG